VAVPNSFSKYIKLVLKNWNEYKCRQHHSNRNNKIIRHNQQNLILYTVYEIVTLADYWYPNSGGTHILVILQFEV
jgi:hypothetical protein